MFEIGVRMWRGLVIRKGFSGLVGFVLVACLMFCVPAHSQAWSGIIDPSRAIDWTKAGIPGGIPNRTTVCKAVSPSGHVNDDDMNAIDNAIASCPEGQVVKLGSGTFTITNGITFGTKNNVTLRGAGPDQTTLKFTSVGRHKCGGGGSICLWGNNGTPTGPASYPGSHVWKGTTSVGVYSQGATTLILDSVSGLSVGQIIIPDQRNDDIGMLASPNGATENGCPTAPCTVTVTTSIRHGYTVGQTVGVGGKDLASGYVGYFKIIAVPSPTTFQYTLNTGNLANSGGGYTTVDTNGVIVSGNRHITIGENLDVGRACPDAMNPVTCQTGEISWRSQTEVKVVTAVDAVNNRITISPGLYYSNWRTSQAPGVYWLGTTSGTDPNNLSGNYAIRDGIEDLTVDYTNNGGTNNNAGVSFRRSYQCWIKNIRSIKGDRNHVWIRDGSMQNEVIDSYFVGQKGAASQSYGVEMFGATANNLVQNNICEHIVVCIMSGGSVQ